MQSHRSDFLWFNSRSHGVQSFSFRGLPKAEALGLQFYLTIRGRMESKALALEAFLKLKL